MLLDVFSVSGGALLDRPCMDLQSSDECCACDPSQRFTAPSMCVCVCVSMSCEVISSFRSVCEVDHR